MQLLLVEKMTLRYIIFIALLNCCLRLLILAREGDPTLLVYEEQNYWQML